MKGKPCTFKQSHLSLFISALLSLSLQMSLFQFLHLSGLYPLSFLIPLALSLFLSSSYPLFHSVIFYIPLSQSVYLFITITSLSHYHYITVSLYCAVSHMCSFMLLFLSISFFLPPIHGVSLTSLELPINKISHISFYTLRRHVHDMYKAPETYLALVIFSHSIKIQNIFRHLREMFFKTN